MRGKNRTSTSGICRLLFIAIVLTQLDCAAPYYEVQPLKLDGATYTGASVDGAQIVLTLKTGESGWSGSGTFGSDEIVFVEGGTKRVVGKLIFSDGRSQPAAIEFSTDGKVTLEVANQPLALKPGGTVSPAKAGPFSGHYEAKAFGSLMDALFLTQSGNIISGTAIILMGWRWHWAGERGS